MLQPNNSDTFFDVFFVNKHNLLIMTLDVDYCRMAVGMIVGGWLLERECLLADIYYIKRGETGRFTSFN